MLTHIYVTGQAWTIRRRDMRIAKERQGQYHEALATLEAAVARSGGRIDRNFVELLTTHANYLRKRSGTAV
jgi:hypothetical protein